MWDADTSGWPYKRAPEPLAEVILGCIEQVALEFGVSEIKEALVVRGGDEPGLLITAWDGRKYRVDVVPL